MTRSSSRGTRQPLSRMNLTGFTKPTSGKNREYLIRKKKLENIFKNWLCPNVSCCPKKSELLKILGGCSSPPPPPPHGPYAYGNGRNHYAYCCFKSKNGTEERRVRHVEVEEYENNGWRVCTSRKFKVVLEGTFSQVYLLMTFPYVLNLIQVQNVV